MKFSAATATVLGMMPVVLGKAIHNSYPVRRTNHIQIGGDGHSVEKVPASDATLDELARLIGLHRGSGQSINFLWVNFGGGAATTVIGEASTVTVTQTVAPDATATAPPADVTDVPGTTTVDVPPSTTVVAGGATHSVTVGGPSGLIFAPQELKAAVGDTVIFTFLSQNHTATQSSFDKPCEPIEGGMDSGFQANPNNTVNPPPQVAMQVMVDTPLWFYCRQGNHCGKGMVFSINPTAEKTHAQFQAKAIEQAGDGEGGGITGNPPPAGESSTVTAPPATTATDAAGSIQTGVGTVGPDGSCVCAVQCSFNGFPNQVQGRDSFGGWGGALPMSMFPAHARRA